MQPLANAVHCRLTLRFADLLKRFRDLLQPPLDHFLLQLRLVLEIFVDVRVAHLQALCHRHNRQPVGTMQSQQTFRCIQDPLARCSSPSSAADSSANRGQQITPLIPVRIRIYLPPQQPSPGYRRSQYHPFQAALSRLFQGKQEKWLPGGNKIRKMSPQQNVQKWHLKPAPARPKHDIPRCSSKT